MGGGGRKWRDTACLIPCAESRFTHERDKKAKENHFGGEKRQQEGTGEDRERTNESQEQGYRRHRIPYFTH